MNTPTDIYNWTDSVESEDESCIVFEKSKFEDLNKTYKVCKILTVYGGVQAFTVD